ncbi:MAG: NAD/NADP octopine/nopaline dehydrogenase family protein [Candidatus Sericytochromatia bacterium]|nr:NAD/NADP octopine/nopaline dehydrogenase family protein [Candidatus Sericytochromatia bacterium]
MAAVVPTLNQRNAFRRMAETAGITATQLAEEIEMPVDLMTRLFADERLMPDSQIFVRTGMYFWETPGDFLSVDAAGPSLWDLIGQPERAGETFRITLCGMGNLGHVFAGRLANRPGIQVNLLVSSPERVDALMTAMAVNDGIRVRASGGDSVGRPHTVTADPAAVIPESQLVLFCVPTHVQPALLERVVPHMTNGTLLGAIPAVGGFHWLAQQALARHDKQAVVFGMVSIPWMCKVVQQGQEVRILGAKQVNGIATLAQDRVQHVADLMAALTGAAAFDLGSFLQITLNPGNQLLHPGIMYSLFRDWQGEALPWAEAPLFYEGLSEAGAGILSDLSDELQAIRAAVEAAQPGLSLEAVLPLQMSVLGTYGDLIPDQTSLRTIIASNPAYAGIRTPMRAVAGGLVPELNSRFFHEDVPFGLVVLRSLAQLGGVATPKLDMILTWAQGLMGKSYLVDGRMTGPDMAESGAPVCFGLTSMAEVIHSSERDGLTTSLVG